MFYPIVITAAIVLLAILVVLSPFFLKWLAEENVFFTAVREGTCKAIVRGKSFDRFILAFEGYHLNDPTKPWYKENHHPWEVLYHGKNNTNDFAENDDDYYDDRSVVLKHLGLHWVGWPWANSVYVYSFEWNETYTNKDGAEKVLPRAEPTDFIFVADFTYAISTEGAETSDRLATDELTLVTVAIRNPYRALFSGEDWMRRVTAAINRHVRSFVGNEEFQTLISTQNSTAFSEPIISLSERLPDDKKGKPPYGLQGRYGVEIRTADLQTITLSGEGKDKHQEAAARMYVAEQEAKSTRLDGQARADVIEMIGDKEASALDKRLKVIKEHGEAGITLAGYDAIQESSKGPGNTVIWANNPLGALAGILKPEMKGDKSP